MTSDVNLKQILQQGLVQMGIALTDTMQTQLLNYVALLNKWSKAYNLTTIRNPASIIPVHILDSLSVLKNLKHVRTVLDVGTGAGLPGIPLAIARPDIHFTLVDGQQKKVNFIQHVITSLQLTNVTAVWQRIEVLPANSPIKLPVDMIVSRAFASLSEFVNLIVNICNSQTKILAMKGRYDLVQQELQALPASFKLANIERITVPGIEGERCLVLLELTEG